MTSSSRCPSPGRHSRIPHWPHSGKPYCCRPLYVFELFVLGPGEAKWGPWRPGGRTPHLGAVRPPQRGARKTCGRWGFSESGSRAARQLGTRGKPLSRAAGCWCLQHLWATVTECTSVRVCVPAVCSRNSGFLREKPVSLRVQTRAKGRRGCVPGGVETADRPQESGRPPEPPPSLSRHRIFQDFKQKPSRTTPGADETAGNRVMRAEFPAC